MAEVKWIKIVTDVFDDEKTLMIETLPDADSIIVIWFKLLCLAGKQNNSGVFLMGRMPYTDEMFATVFRRPLNTVRLALKTFEDFGMIEIINDTVTIPNWEKHQSIDKLDEIREQTRLRVAKHREKQKSLSCNVTVTQRNATEEEKEEDKEKEIHSFNHSCENAYIEKKVEESELEGDDADVYRKELQEGLKLKYMSGTLGQGILFMSDEQFADLCSKLTIDELDKYCDIVVECERNGKKYKRKSHYQAILDMASKDRKIS